LRPLISSNNTWKTFS